MKPRERCIAAIELEEPDRVPLVLRIRPEPMEKLRARLGARDDEDVNRALGVDLRGVGIGLKGGFQAEGPPCEEGGWFIGERAGRQVVRDIFGFETIWSPDHTYTYTFTSHPLQKIPLDQYPWPEPDVDQLPQVERSCKAYEDYLINGGVNHMFEVAWKLTGFPQFMLKMYREPRFVEEILDHLNEIRTEQAMLLAEAGADVIYDGDDVGTQVGMMISPEHWRRFLKPRYEEMIRRVKKRHHVYAFFHSDGKIEPIIPDLIEIGVDILNPVQPECMDPVWVKETYGDRLCLDGTIGVQSTLPFGTVEAVIREVEERIRTIGETGLILGPTHNIQPDISVEKILALYETARKYGVNPRRTIP